MFVVLLSLLLRGAAEDTGGAGPPRTDGRSTQHALREALADEERLQRILSHVQAAAALEVPDGAFDPQTRFEVYDVSPSCPDAHWLRFNQTELTKLRSTFRIAHEYVPRSPAAAAAACTARYPPSGVCDPIALQHVV